MTRKSVDDQVRAVMEELGLFGPCTDEDTSLSAITNWFVAGVAVCYCHIIYHMYYILLFYLVMSLRRKALLLFTPEAPLLPRRKALWPSVMRVKKFFKRVIYY